MNKRKVFIENLKAKLAAWKTEVDGLQAKADMVDIQSRAQYCATIMEIVGKIQQAEKKLIVFQIMIDKTSADAWRDLIHRAERAWMDLEESVKKAKESFKIQN